MSINIEFNLFNLIDGETLTLYQSTITGGGKWNTSPPKTLSPNKPNHCDCTCPDQNSTVTLVYKPDNVKLLTVSCRPDLQALNANSSGSPGYTVGLAPGGVSPNYILGVNYKKT